MRRAGTVLAALAGMVLVFALFSRLTTSSGRQGRLGIETPAPTATDVHETRPALDVLPTPPVQPPWWVAISTDTELRLVPLADGTPERHELPGGAHSDAQPRLLPVGGSLLVYTNDGIWRYGLGPAPAVGAPVAAAGTLAPGHDRDSAWIVRRDEEWYQVRQIGPDGTVQAEGTVSFPPRFGLAPDRLVGIGDGVPAPMVRIAGIRDGVWGTSRGGSPVASWGEQLAWCAFRCRDMVIQKLPDRPAPGWNEPDQALDLPVARIHAPEGMLFDNEGVFDSAGGRLAVPLRDESDHSRRGVAVIDTAAGTVTVVLPPAREFRQPHHLLWTPDDRHLVVTRRDSLVLWEAETRRLYRVPLDLVIEPWNGFAMAAR